VHNHTYARAMVYVTACDLGKSFSLES